MRLRIGRRKILESLPIFAAAVAFAAPPAQAQPAAPHWTVNHGEVYCTLGRDNGPNAVNFALRVIPGTDRVELLVTSRQWRHTPMFNGQGAELALLPGVGGPIKARARASRLPGGGPLLAFLDLGSGFVDRLAEASQLRVIRDRRTLLALDLPNSGRAVATLRDCFERALTAWGMDVAARGRMRALPSPIGSPFSGSDYPTAALREDAQGVAIVRLMIGSDGRVAECAVLRTSGSADLDARTCQVYRRDGRFQPAIGEDGEPVAAGTISTVIWGISG